MSRGRAFTTAAAAEYVGLAEQTVRNLLASGAFPVPHKHGAKNVWFADELDSYLARNVTGYMEVHALSA